MTVVTVISCSDAALEDVSEDRAGTVLREGLASLGFQVTDPQIVPCDSSMITSALVDAFHAGSRVVITAGASGLLPQDAAVEATMPLVESEIPGISNSTSGMVASTATSCGSNPLAPAVIATRAPP